MPELPWIKWFPAYWASEPGLKNCEISTRGVWFEALNTMFLTKSSSVSGTYEELAQKFGCRISQVQLAVQQLKKYKVAEVYEHNGNIILTSRRAERDCKIRGLRRKAGIASGTKRQQRTKKHSEHTSSSSSPSTSNSEGGVGETEVNGSYHQHSRTALHWLNQLAARAYREVDTNLAVISARLKEPGVDIEGVKRMIERQCKFWVGTDMEAYLRPATLFGKEKFDAYYGARDAPVIHSSEKPKPTMVGTDIDRRRREIQNFNTDLPE